MPLVPIPPTEPEEGLECCQDCRSRLVYPLRCKRIARDSWQLDLRCPDCGRTWRQRGTTAAVRGFDRMLAAGRALLVSHLEEIERIEREDEIDRFRSALIADAILPEDFGR